MNLLLITVAFHDILLYIIALNELSDNLHMSTYSYMHFLDIYATNTQAFNIMYPESGCWFSNFKKPAKNQWCKLSHNSSIYGKLSSKMQRHFSPFFCSFFCENRMMDCYILTYHKKLSDFTVLSTRTNPPVISLL